MDFSKMFSRQIHAPKVPTALSSDATCSSETYSYSFSSSISSSLIPSFSISSLSSFFSASSNFSAPSISSAPSIYSSSSFCSSRSFHSDLLFCSSSVGCTRGNKVSHSFSSCVTSAISMTSNIFSNSSYGRNNRSTVCSRLSSSSTLESLSYSSMPASQAALSSGSYFSESMTYTNTFCENLQPTFPVQPPPLTVFGISSLSLLSTPDACSITSLPVSNTLSSTPREVHNFISDINGSVAPTTNCCSIVASSGAAISRTFDASWMSFFCRSRNSIVLSTGGATSSGGTNSSGRFRVANSSCEANSSSRFRFANSTGRFRVANSSDGLRVANSSDGLRVANSSGGLRAANSSDGLRIANLSGDTGSTMSSSGARAAVSNVIAAVFGSTFLHLFGLIVSIFLLVSNRRRNVTSAARHDRLSNQAIVFRIILFVFFLYLIHSFKYVFLLAFLIFILRLFVLNMHVRFYGRAIAYLQDVSTRFELEENTWNIPIIGTAIRRGQLLLQSNNFRMQGNNNAFYSATAGGSRSGVRIDKSVDVAEILKNHKDITRFECPITQELFVEPVVAADGFTYERSAIQEWMLCNRTSPMTLKKLRHTVLTPNYTLKAVMLAFLQQDECKNKIISSSNP